MGKNGVGDRFARKLFNYTVIYNNHTRTYSENEESIDYNYIKHFQENNKSIGIIGILIHSKKILKINRNIRKDISSIIKKNSCVSCGSKNNIVCDHKNDLYNDTTVLNIKTQKLSDFQALCNHCNLQKRQICKEEIRNKKLYSAKNLEKYKIFPFEFPWEKKNFDIEDYTTKIDSYWYDPIEFNKKIYLYNTYIIPILKEIKKMT